MILNKNLKVYEKNNTPQEKTFLLNQLFILITPHQTQWQLINMVE